MKKQYLVTTIFAIYVVIFSNAYGLPGEGVVLDPNTGNYLITYYGAGAPGDKKNKILRKVIFVPATKIEPIVQSAFKNRGDGEIAYTYRVTNGIKSRQPLDMSCPCTGFRPQVCAQAHGWGQGRLRFFCIEPLPSNPENHSNSKQQ